MKVDTPYASIRSVPHSSGDAVIGALASAFVTDPLVRWLFREPAADASVQSGFYRSLLDHPRAEAYLADSGDGASIWLHLRAGEHLHDDQAPPSPVDGPIARLRALGDALATRHPVDEPHLYLAVMGVAAGRQGRGIGTALLRHRLESADREGSGAYLEASSPRSRALYLRHGFTDLGAPVRLADAPPIYPMWRPPTSADRSDRNR